MGHSTITEPCVFVLGKPPHHESDTALCHKEPFLPPAPNPQAGVMGSDGSSGYLSIRSSM